MRKLHAVVWAFVLGMGFGIAQNAIDDYSYIVIPEKFDFLQEKDQYQLNSLTRFLFDKHGFNAYFPNDLPNVRRCDGLWAEVSGSPAMIYTKVTISINDCNGNPLFVSQEGRSKLKALDKTFQDALRKAFKSIEALGVNQRDIQDQSSPEVPIDHKEKVVPPPPSPAVQNTEDSTGEIQDIKTAVKSQIYTFSGKQYTLVPKKFGYTVIELSAKGELPKGRLLAKGVGVYRFEDAFGNSFRASFNDRKELVVNSSFQDLIFVPQD